jgi:hypothetical protein
MVQPQTHKASGGTSGTSNPGMPDSPSYESVFPALTSLLHVGDHFLQWLVNEAVSESFEFLQIACINEKNLNGKLR